MPSDDNNKVVRLRQPQPKAAAGVGVPVADDPISPKSLLNMTPVEQEIFLNQLRQRRMSAAEAIKRAQVAKHEASSLANSIKIERKAEQAQRQYVKASKALERLEEIIYDLRALTLHLTDTDISK